MDNLDTAWIKNFESEDKDYNIFYKEPINNMKLYLLYINSHNELEKINEETLILTNENIIDKYEIVKLIKTYDMNNGTKYKLLSILKYNIDLEPDNIDNYIKYPDDYEFLDSIKHIENISLKPCISILQDINSLYLVFYEKKKSNNHTKKIIISNTKKKTKRKRV